jgi:tRNA-specific 2-thiouridylase
MSLSRKERVLVAMSGGVDSAVAAALLVEKGYEVIGVTMHLWDHRESAEPSGRGRCCGSADVGDARRAAAALGIRHYVLNFKDRFRHSVVDPFVEAYRTGRTPIPCIACNSSLKFDDLAAKAGEVGADLMATGHYARIHEGRNGRRRILRAVDRRKDQTYFLFDVRADQIGKVLFPVGELPKDEVRETARAFGLPVAEKPESQEICFIPDGDTAGFVTLALGDTAPPSGDIVDTQGNVLGRHAGIHRYTVGQRRGFGLTGGPWYVVQVDAAANRLVMGADSEVYRTTFKVSDVNWLGPPRPRTTRCTVKIRNTQGEGEGAVRFLSADSAEVTLAAPARAVAPGQAAVFYRRDWLLGGGWIA